VCHAQSAKFTTARAAIAAAPLFVGWFHQKTVTKQMDRGQTENSFSTFSLISTAETSDIWLT